MADYSIPCDQRPNAKEAPFEPSGSDQPWIAAVVERFGVWPRGEGYVFTGICPRCCHEIDAPVDKSYGAAEETVPVTLVCNCRQHKSEDAELPGCGRFGNFDLQGVA